MDESPTKPKPKRNLGRSLGAAAGGFLGNVLGNKVSRIFGRGEYKENFAEHAGVPVGDVVENDLPEINTLVKPLSSAEAVQIMHSGHEGSLEITRREFVDFVAIRDEWLYVPIDITPSNPALHPWLSQLAPAFQQFEYLGIAFEYVPTSGYAVGSTNAALGQIIMAPVYDVNTFPVQHPYGNERALLNYQGAMSCSPAAPGTCYVECDPKLRNQEVLYTEPKDPLDPSFSNWSDQNYIHSRLYVFTGGAQNAQFFQAGQLYVTYHMRFFNPRVESITAPPALIPDFMSRIAALLSEFRYLRHSLQPLTQREYVVRQVRMSEIKSYLKSLEFARLMDRNMLVQAKHALNAPEIEEKCATDVDIFLAKAARRQGISLSNKEKDGGLPLDQRSEIGDDWSVSDVPGPPV